MPMPDDYPCPANPLGEHNVKYASGWFCPECGARLILGIWHPPKSAQIDGQACDSKGVE